MKRIRKYIEKYKGVILYGLFGVLTTLINVVTYYICYDLIQIVNVISTIIAWVVAVTFAFVTNKAFVFESRSWGKETTLSEAIKFYGCRIGTGIIELLMMYVSVDVLGWNGTAMKLITNIVVIILNYVFSKVFVFRKKEY